MSKTLNDLNTEQLHAVIQLVLDYEKHDNGSEGFGIANEISSLPKILGVDEKTTKKLVRQLQALEYVTTESEAAVKTVKIGKLVRPRAILRTYVRVTEKAHAIVAETRELLASLEEPVAEAA